MLKLKQLNRFLTSLLPGNGVVDFAPNGLQVEGKQNIERSATAVTASLAAIEAAIDLGVDALIVHHGLFWQRDSYVIDGIKRKKIALLLKHDISLFAFHLPLDLHPEIGNNWRAAQEMGWSKLQPFGSMNGVPIGVKGYVKSCSAQDFKIQLENYYKHPAACALGGPEQVRTVGLISGGAHKSILDASKEGLDAFVTGSFDEPIWHQAMEEGIHFYALGHSATERVGPRSLALLLEEKFDTPCGFIDIENPF